jgi:hypothetical protein
LAFSDEHPAAEAAPTNSWSPPGYDPPTPTTDNARPNIQFFILHSAFCILHSSFFILHSPRIRIQNEESRMQN